MGTGRGEWVVACVEPGGVVECSAAGEEGGGVESVDGEWESVGWGWVVGG